MQHIKYEIMNHYLPPQARLQASMSCTHDAPRVQIWNPTSLSPPARVPPSPYYPRQAATPVPAQTALNAQSWRVISPPKPPISGPKTSPSSSNSIPSVKHLTCYFWAKNGVCKWSDDECLYAHHNTGKTANGPLQVEPGREFPCSVDLTVLKIFFRRCTLQTSYAKKREMHCTRHNTLSLR